MLRELSVLVVVSLVASGLPAANAMHLSVGSSDAVGVSPEDEPTVGAEAMQRGLTRPSQCYDEDGEQITDEEDARRAVESDAFCGDLVYNPGTSFRRASPPDQDFRAGFDGTWDVVYVGYVGGHGLSTCAPWCMPVGSTVYTELHNTLHGIDPSLADDAATVKEKGGSRFQRYSVSLNFASASSVAQQETGAWAMNGFIFPQPEGRFLGFLEDDAGEAITPDRLARMHEDLVGANLLSADTVPTVCGFPADTSVGSGPGKICPVTFSWTSEGGDPTNGANLRSQDYSDPCESPAYVCGGLTPAWYANLVCPPGSDCASTLNAFHVWHWVLAPAESTCAGDVDPGFKVDASLVEDAGAPYMAHDLDVYTPAATALGVQGSPHLADALTNTAEATQSQIDQEIANVTAPLPGVPRISVTSPVPREFVKPDRIEPNAPGDNSQAWEVHRPSEGTPCDVFRPSTEEVIDPWRNVINNEMSLDPGQPGVGFYRNDRTNQDESNRPGYGQYYPSGHVGVYADKDDDGIYDRYSWGGDDSVNEAGAYPMVWDLTMNASKLENGSTPAEAMEGGCQSSFSEDPWTEAAKDAGYGPETGLIQVVYLREPTYTVHQDASQVFTFPAGNNAFVLLSDNFADFHETGVNARFVEAQVTEALESVPAEDPTVVYLDELTSDANRDYQTGCSANGDFTSHWRFGHTCGGQPGGALCAGDTVVTRYVLDVASDTGALGGDIIPHLQVGGEAVDFSDAPQAWTDVDPFDGDPDRNDETCSRPEHHTQEDEREDHRGEPVDEQERHPCGHAH